MTPIEYLWNTVSNAAQERIDLVIEEYQRLLPYAEELGLKVNSISVEGGVLPQIKTSLRGKIDNITDETVERIKSENTNILFLAFLDAILLARKINDKLENIYLFNFSRIMPTFIT